MHPEITTYPWEDRDGRPVRVTAEVWTVYGVEITRETIESPGAEPVIEVSIGDGPVMPPEAMWEFAYALLGIAEGLPVADAPTPVNA